MDCNIRKILKYFLLILGFCGLIPHMMLSLLQSIPSSDFWSPVKLESWSHFFVREWIPFWALYISYLRLQKMDNFSILPVIGTALIILTFLPRYDQSGIKAIALILPLMIVQECFALLKNLEFSRNKMLAGMAQNREMLRAFFFWSIAVICVVHIACAWTNVRVLPFFMLPIPAALLYSVFHRLENQPPAVGGIFGMLFMVPVSLWLAIIGPMAFFKHYYVAILSIGFALVFLMLTVYHTDRWRRRKPQ